MEDRIEANQARLEQYRNCIAAAKAEPGTAEATEASIRCRADLPPGPPGPFSPSGQGD